MKKLMFKESPNNFFNNIFIIIWKNNILLKKSTSNLPYVEDLNLIFKTKLFLGEYDSSNIWGLLLQDDFDNSLLNDFYFESIRSTYSLLGEDLFWLIGFSNQILDFEFNHKYCPSCTNPTQTKDSSRAKICSNCGFTQFPTISPAIIVCVTKEDSILLGKNANFKNGMYSILAGFTEPFENLEDCVRREVFEEVGISIKNINYFASQPWPFPNSLMIGFTAEYESGEIKVDEEEIIHADWFKIDELPPIPEGVSISRSLIDNFINSINTK